ncbi:hypothetical protein HYPSUDRAFT_68220 [Hypholoma sublateritium FD-334 SS-4]|uniref:Uncharacterized protein n=1 Tax=Hypholoma sublateritium (strain FD-334 SS-4) TaxID=945553 RepID=A0A0D2NWM6_HYPSF|nr:hypothetical protein HYPSUDRAFT_68220 [Hypholoma sublateritium FD-334 SS-4]
MPGIFLLPPSFVYLFTALWFLSTPISRASGTQEGSCRLLPLRSRRAKTDEENCPYDSIKREASTGFMASFYALSCLSIVPRLVLRLGDVLALGNIVTVTCTVTCDIVKRESPATTAANADTEARRDSSEAS